MDIRDLWSGGLSLRRLSILVENLPPDAGVWADLHGIARGWTLTDLLLADIFHALSGEPHPSRPSPKAAETTSTVQKLLEQQKRLAAQRGATDG